MADHPAHRAAPHRARILGSLVLVALAAAFMAAASNPLGVRIEVESPPESGKFVPADSAIVASLQPNVRVTLGPGTPKPFRLWLISASPGVAPRDVTSAFAGLATSPTASNRLDVPLGSNSIVFTTDESLPLALPQAGGADGGADAGTPNSLGAVLALPVSRATSATMLNIDGAKPSVGPPEVLPIVKDPSGARVEQDTVLVVFARRTPLEQMASILRAQRLVPVGFSFITMTARARITDGRSPPAVAKALSKVPGVTSATPNFELQRPALLGEDLPQRLRSTYAERAGARCAPDGGSVLGCFDFDGPDATNELRISRQHWLMDTFPAHRLVDHIVGPRPAVRPAIADIDTGIGNGTNTTDIPVDATGLYGFSTRPFSWNPDGTQASPTPLTIASVADNFASGHGTQVLAAAVGRGRLALGVGKDLRARPIQDTGPGGGATVEDHAQGLGGACLDRNVVVAILEIWNILRKQGPIPTAAELSAHASEAPAKLNALRGMVAFCRKPFLDTGRDGRFGTLDPGELDGVYQVGEPFSDTDGDGRFDPDRDGKILAMPLGNDGYDFDAIELPSAFVPSGIRTAADSFAFGVAATQTLYDPSGASVREPESLASFSNFGPRVSVSVLGDDVILPDPSGTLIAKGGTSYSTPIAAGLVGEMIFLDANQHAHPRLTPRQILELLEATAERYGTQPGNLNTQTVGINFKPNDNPGRSRGEGKDPAFGYGRINAWKALLAVANGGIPRESHMLGASGAATQFPSVPVLAEPATRWYGFKIYSPVLGATVWLDGVPVRDASSTAPGGSGVTAYAGVRADEFVRLGIDQNNDGVPDEDPTRGIVPVGNEGGQYVSRFSAERSDLLTPAGAPRTLSLRKPGQTVLDAPFFNLVLDLQRMREGQVPGVVFDDFVFEVTPPDFGDAPDRGGLTAARGEQSYPTSLAAEGARHANSNLEWLGKEDQPQPESVTPEHDAVEGAARVHDPDGTANLRRGAGPQTADLDARDDGVVFFPLTYVPGQEGKAEVTVCTADPQYGRYSGSPHDSLYVNGWIDWNGADGWQETGGEHVVDGAMIRPMATANWLVLRGAGFLFKRVSPSHRCATFEASFPVPAAIAPGPLWARFRLDYGENAGRVNPAPYFISDRSLQLSQGLARYGEVEDYLLGSDFGDAPDPYATRKAVSGARHLDIHREWLGKAGSGAPSATRETDACDLTPAEEDGVPNLGPGCQKLDADKKDDGAGVPAVVQPGSVITVEMDVSAKIDAFGFANRGPHYESSAGVMTLKPDCRLGPIAKAPETPIAHRDRGRYAAWDPRRRLYLSVWVDWSADGNWAETEKVLSAPLDPEDWGGDGQYTLGEPFIDTNGDGVRSEGEAFTDVAGLLTRHLACQFSVPKGVAMGKTYAWRFRVDYGEDGATHDEVVHHATEDNRALSKSTGGALWGEVEDYPQCAKELDEFYNTTASITAEGPFGSQRITLSGPTTVVADICHVADTDGDGLEQVATEMTQLDLHGMSVIGPVTVRLRDPKKHPYKKTVGEIEEKANATPGVLDLPPFTPTGKAESYFDVYFEAQVGGRTLHSHEPKRMEATISYKPPRDIYRSISTLQLYDEDEKPSDLRIGGATHAPGEDTRICDRQRHGQVSIEPHVGLALAGYPLTLGADVGYAVTPDRNGSVVAPLALQLGAGGVGALLPLGFQYEWPVLTDGLWVAPRLSAGLALSFSPAGASADAVVIPEVELKYVFCGGLNVGAVPLSFPTYIGGGGVFPTYRFLLSAGSTF